MGGGLESRWVGRVYGADGAVARKMGYGNGILALSHQLSLFH